MDGADRPRVLSLQEAQRIFGDLFATLGEEQRVALEMYVRSRVAFAVETQRQPPRAAPAAPPGDRDDGPRQSRIPPQPGEPAPDAELDGGYLDGGAPGESVSPEDRERAEVSSLESYRERVRRRAEEAGLLRSQPGGVDTRYLDNPPPTQGVTYEQVVQIAEQVANAVLSRYAAERMPALSPAGAPAPGLGSGYVPAAPAPGYAAPPPVRYPFAPYYPGYRR